MKWWRPAAARISISIAYQCGGKTVSSCFQNPVGAWELDGALEGATVAYLCDLTQQKEFARFNPSDQPFHFSIHFHHLYSPASD